MPPFLGGPLKNTHRRVFLDLGELAHASQGLGGCVQSDFRGFETPVRPCFGRGWSGLFRSRNMVSRLEAQGVFQRLGLLSFFWSRPQVIAFCLAQ